MLACAPRMRSEIGKLASPKKPMLNVVAKTIASPLMKAAVAAKTGWQRAASHNSIGNSSATGTTVPQNPCGRKMTNPFRMTSATSAATPSKNPRHDGGCRAAEANSMISGATVMIPRASEANQCCQIVRIGAFGL